MLRPSLLHMRAIKEGTKLKSELNYCMKILRLFYIKRLRNNIATFRMRRIAINPALSHYLFHDSNFLEAPLIYGSFIGKLLVCRLQNKMLLILKNFFILGLHKIKVERSSRKNLYKKYLTPLFPYNNLRGRRLLQML